MSKKLEMPYTSAFIQELMRFRTLVPLNLPHKTNAKVNLDGYVIPEETMVMKVVLKFLSLKLSSRSKFLTGDLVSPRAFQGILREAMGRGLH